MAGHGRLLAAQLLYREDPGQLLATDQPGPGLVPVRFLEFASDGEAAALAIADNRLTEANPMDDGVVADLLRELQESGTSIEGLGYDDGTLNALLSEQAPEPQETGLKPEDQAEGFADSDIKRVTLVYPREDFAEVIQLLDDALTEFGLEDYSNLVLQLLRSRRANP